jgi:hypothetical protein
VSKGCGFNCTSKFFFALSDPVGSGQREMWNKILAVCKPCCYSEVTILIQWIGINNKIYIQITAIFTHPADWYIHSYIHYSQDNERSFWCRNWKCYVVYSSVFVLLQYRHTRERYLNWQRLQDPRWVPTFA